MPTITLQIPDYDPEQGLINTWENDFKIQVESQTDRVLITANNTGLISLAKQLLTLSNENIPSGTHFHLDEYNSLENNSVELIICKL